MQRETCIKDGDLVYGYIPIAHTVCNCIVRAPNSSREGNVARGGAAAADCVPQRRVQHRPHSPDRDNDVGGKTVLRLPHGVNVSPPITPRDDEQHNGRKDDSATEVRYQLKHPTRQHPHPTQAVDVFLTFQVGTHGVRNWREHIVSGRVRPGRLQVAIAVWDAKLFR
eukprot:6515308-Pyramimonas_sp.AAC.1